MTLAEILEKRGNELQEQIAALRVKLAPLEKEMSQIRRVQFVLNGKPNPPKDRPKFRETMKDLAVKALAEQFPGGATAAELLDFIHHGYGRADIHRESFAPQLSRLKQAGLVIRLGRTWCLHLPAEPDGTR